MARRTYGGNEALSAISGDQRNGSAAPGAAGQAEAGAGAQEGPQSVPRAEGTVHLILRIGSDDEQAALEAWLTAQGFAPQTEYVTQTAVSFRLNQTDPNVVAERMRRGQADVGWTVVPPGDPDYLLRQFFVEGPDGRRFRYSDIPAATPVGAVASELFDHYPETLPGADQPTVVDQVAPDGSGRRMNPDNSLHEEGVTEDSTLRVGFQRQAAAVNPLDRREALFGVRNQMQAYVDTHPGFLVTPNSPALPTEYYIEFTQPSFGPPDTPGFPPGDQPPDIHGHELSIVLTPDFPITAPRVRWVSDVFHPNVFPTYECDALRQRPYMHGLVCLGTLDELYQPSLDFAELCDTLRDIAGYRNYSVFVVSGDAVDERTGLPLPRGDYYDRDAAMWACSAEGQERIEKIGGVPLLRLASAQPARYGFDIELDK